MSKITILKVINKEEISKKGKPYTRCSIKTTDRNGQEVWLSGFGNNTTKSWADGQVVELEVYQEEYNGKTSLKFHSPQDINQLELLLSINRKLDILLGKSSTASRPVYPETPTAADLAGRPDDVKVDEIPF